MKVCLYLSLLSAASALSKKQSPHSETGAITLESTQHGSEGESDAVSGKIPPAIGDTDKPGETAGTSMAQLAEAFHHPTGENGAAATFLTTDEGSDSSSKNDQISGKIGGATGTAMIELAEGHHEDAALDIDSSHGGDNSLLDVEGVTGDVGAVTGSSFLETMATALNPSFWHGHIFGPLSSTASGPSPATSLVAFGSRHGGSSFATSGGGTRSTSGGGTRAMGGLGGTSAHGAGAGAMGGLGGMGGGFSPSPSPFWGSGSTGDAGSAPHPHGVGTRVHGGAAVDPAVHAAAAGAYAAHAGAAAGDLPPPPPPPPSFPDMSSASLEVEAHVGALQLRAHSDHAATHDSSTGSHSTHFWDAGPALMVMMDGFFFGFLKGFALGFVGESIGYLISIALARTCFKSRMRVWLAQSDMLREVLTVCEEDTTGKFLVLFRFLSLPVWAKNYTIGMLEISWLKSYLIFIPGECFYAAIFSYIGSKGHIIAAAIRKGNTQKALDSFSGLELAIVGVSLLGGGMMILLGWREYNARRDAVAEGAKAESTPLKSA